MINLYDILDAADGQLFGEPNAQIFNGFCFDAGQVRPGELFVTLKTERGDGHHYMEEAVRGGATGLMCTHPPSFDTDGITVIVMRDVETALLRWTRYILNKHSTTVIAVTGSMGKSTTCRAIRQVLGTRYEVYYSETDFAGRFGIPLALSKLDSHHQLAILEFAPQQPGEIEVMMTAAEPSVGVVMHLDGDEHDPLFAEARSMVAMLPQDGLSVLNFDSPTLRKLHSAAEAPVMSLSVDREGTSFGADLTAYNLVVGVDKTGFDLRYGSERYVGKWVHLLGTHQLYAVLAALAVGLAFDVPLDDACAALTHLEPLPGRMSPLNGINGCLLIDNTFNASPASLLAALDWLTAVIPRPSIRETQIGQVSPFGRIYVILGDLGTRQSIDARALGEKLSVVAHMVIAEGDTVAPIARAILERGINLTLTHITYSPGDTVAAVRDVLGEKDVVLVLGSHNAHMERVVAALLADTAALDRLARPHTDAQPHYHTWVQVDIEAIAHNMQNLAALTAPDCKLMAVVKGNAYGHGAVMVSTTAVLNGADYLGVVALEEALELREGGIIAPILVLGYTPPQMIETALRHDLTLTLYDQSLARVLNRAAGAAGKTIRVHVRVDMGTGDIGLPPEEVATFFRALIRLEFIQVEGVYTTLENGERANTQLAAFQEVVMMLKAGDFKFDYIHAANSAAMFSLPEAHFDMVRCGMALYGIAGEHPLPEIFKPALSWKTSVVQVKRRLGQMTIDENGVPIANRSQSVAVLPVGYMHGIRWGGRSWGRVLIKGEYAPIAGNVGAYQTLVDVSDIKDVRIGDEVVLIGKQDKRQIRIEEVATAMGARPDELLMNLMPNTPRIKI